MYKYITHMYLHTLDSVIQSAIKVIVKWKHRVGSFKAVPPNRPFKTATQGSPSRGGDQPDKAYVVVEQQRLSTETIAQLITTLL